MSEASTRLAAALAERYRIERELGQGGMATVYLAEDVRHHRKVAIKVLHPELSAVLGPDRFLKEIELTANLQHPHILPLFDSGSADGLLYYVMPYVEGESLRNRLTRDKQLPIPDTVRIASEVASALDYAHRRGVVHRDIKPENILLHDGRALVADFGIALAVVQAGGSRMTQTGMSLGTPQYMSPEQAVGERDLTPRSDIYALGVLCYEMLTGDPPFTGSTTQAILAQTMNERPAPPRRTRDTIPPHVESAILIALAKLPADRWETAREFSDALSNPGLTASRAPAVELAGVGARPRRRRLRAGALGAGLLVGGAALGWLLRPERPRSTIAAEFFVDADSSHLMDLTSLQPLAVSPDGQRIAYRGRTREGRLMLFQRRLDDRRAQLVSGTDNADHPFFSADGQWLAFDADGELRKVPVTGGTPTLIAKVPGSTAGGTWNRAGVIVYSGGFPRALYRVSADGGTPERITRPDSARGQLHLRPAFSPDGRTVAFTISEGLTRALPVASAVRLGFVRMDDTGVTILDVPALGPHLVGSDQIVYAVEDGGILRRRFDQRTLRFTGPEQRVGDGVNVFARVAPMLDVSNTGLVAFQPGSQDDQSLVLADGAGGERRILSGPGLWGPRFSPQGDRIAYSMFRGTDRGRDLWVYSIPQGTTRRLTSRIFNAIDPSWTPDGKQLVFAGGDSTKSDLYLVSADGGEEPRVLLHLAGFEGQAVVTPDGHRALFAGVGPGKSDRDILSVKLLAPGAAEPVIQTDFDEGAPALSPDGHWLAYQSNQDGAPAVYVRPSPGPGQTQMVSNAPAREPAWSRDGKVLYYRVGTTFVSAALTLGPSITVRDRKRLLDAPYVTGRTDRNYDVDPAGKGLLVIKVATQSRLVVRTNVLSAERN